MQVGALLLIVSLLGPSLQEPLPRPMRLADPAAVNLCELGREIARLGVCTDPKSCRALQLWRTYYGPPAPDLAAPEPRSRQRISAASAPTPYLRHERGSRRGKLDPYRELLRTQHCWADAETPAPKRR